MLQSIREGMVSPFAKILLFILAAAMVGFYGFSGSCGGAISQNVSATVDGEEISQVEVSRALQNIMAYQQSLGLDFSKLPPNMINMLQRQALDGLIQQKLLLKQAKSLGMVMPKNAVKKTIQEQFTQDDQKFDFQQYKNILTRIGQTPAQFEKEQGERLIVNSLYQAFNAVSQTPPHLLKADFAIDNTKAKVSYLKVNADTIKNKLKVEQASDEDLQNYFDKNKSSYLIPEKRSFTVSWLNLNNYLPKPNNDDLNSTLKSSYTSQQKKDLAKERYRARHILIKGDSNKSKAQAIYQRLKSGGNFAQIAIAESEDPGSKVKGGDLGYFSKGMMVQEFQNAVESLDIGEISKPVKSSFGYHVIELLDKIDAGSNTVDRLKNELSYTWQSKALEQEKYKTLASNKAKEEFETRSTSKRYSNIDQNANLPGLPDSNDTSIIIGKAMSSKADQKTDIFNAASKNYIYQIEVTDIKESNTPEFASIKSKIKSDYMQDAYNTAFSTFIAQKNQQLLKKEVSSLQSITQELGLNAQTTAWFTAKTSSIPNLNLDVDEIIPALSMKKGDLFPKTFIEGSNHYFVSVADIQEPDWKKFDASKNDDNSNTQNTQKITQWINSLKENASIEIAGETQGS